MLYKLHSTEVEALGAGVPTTVAVRAGFARHGHRSYVDWRRATPMPRRARTLIGAAGIDGQIEHVTLENTDELFVFLNQFLKDITIR